MSFVHQRSPGGAHLRSPGGAKNIPPQYSYFQLIYGAVPVCGFGTFKAGSTWNSYFYFTSNGQPGLVFNDVWPDVYLTLTESLVDVYVITASDPPWYFPGTSTATSTRSATYSQNSDQFFTSTTTDPNGFFGNGYDPGSGRTLVSSTVSAAGTVFTMIWTKVITNSSGQQIGTETVTYTATVSNQLLAASAWGNWAIQSAALVADYPFPSFTDTTAYQPYPLSWPSHGPGASGAWQIFPTAAAPGYIEGFGFSGAYGAGNSISGGQWGTGPIVAAAYGIGCRVAGTGTVPGNSVPTGAMVPVTGAYVQDEPSPGSIAGTAIVGNAGFVVSIASRWMLLGAAVSFPVLTDNNTTHRQGLWCQEMSLATGSGAPSFGSYCPLSRPPPGIGLSTFWPADASNALASAGFIGPYFGMLGFRLSTSRKSSAGSENIGAGDATIGAGGTI